MTSQSKVVAIGADAPAPGLRRCAGADAGRYSDVAQAGSAADDVRKAALHVAGRHPPHTLSSEKNASGPCGPVRRVDASPPPRPTPSRKPSRWRVLANHVQAARNRMRREAGQADRARRVFQLGGQGATLATAGIEQRQRRQAGRTGRSRLRLHRRRARDRHPAVSPRKPCRPNGRQRPAGYEVRWPAMSAAISVPLASAGIGARNCPSGPIR